MGDNIELYDRNGVRTPMQWDDSKNAGFSDADETYSPVITGPEYGYRKVNVAAQENDPESYLAATRFLLTVRKAHPELQAGELVLLDNASRAVFGYWRVLGEARTLCLYNLSSEVQSISLHFPELSGQLVDLLHEGRSWSLDAYMPPVLKMRPWASHWLHVKID